VCIKTPPRITRKMIIPVRCMSCGKVLANKWNYFKKKRDQKASGGDKPDEDGFYPERLGEVLDELGLVRICCRRHMICHVDLIDEI